MVEPKPGPLSSGVVGDQHAMPSLAEAVAVANPAVLDDDTLDKEEHETKPLITSMEVLARGVTVANLPDKRAPKVALMSEEESQDESSQLEEIKVGHEDCALALLPPDLQKATPPKGAGKSLLLPRSTASGMKTRSASKQAVFDVSQFAKPGSVGRSERRNLTAEERQVMDVSKACPRDLEFARPFYVALDVSESTNQAN